MFVILSEFDNLKWLMQNGIYPDEFYTDADLFQKKMLMHHDVDILVIFAGFCSFRRRVVCDMVTRMRDRSNINSITVLSDGVLPMLDEYYKFMNLPTVCYPYSHWDKTGGAVDILSEFKGERRKPKKFVPKGKPFSEPKLNKDEQKEQDILELVKIPELLLEMGH